MKCPSCETDNRDGVNYCKKCGVDLTLSPPWKPTWRWHLKTLAVIYGILIVLYFSINRVLNRLPEPYHPRQIPKELTPWLSPKTP